MSHYVPDDKKIEALVESAERRGLATDLEQEGYVFSGIFNRDSGIYAEKQKPANLWTRDTDGRLWRQKRTMSRREWIERHFYIQKKNGEIAPLVLNRAQRRLELSIIKMERAGVPVRVVITKARQMGFCGSPETRVLTADLQWRTLEEIEVGTEIVAVDENIVGGRGSERRMRTGVVQAKVEVFEPAFRLKMSNGETLTLTGPHRMLCQQRGGDFMRWRAADTMKVGDEIRHITKPWGETTTEDSWFGGILDGEGSMSKAEAKESPSVCAAQLRGPVWDRMENYLKGEGYNYCIESDGAVRPSKFGKRPVPKLVVGRMNELFKLIGKTRPTRFSGRRWWEGRTMPGKRTGQTTASIVSIEALGQRRMIDLQTSTKTFIAEGFVSHNSTYVQAVMFERLLRGTRVRCLIVADTRDRSSLLLSIAETARMNMPKPTWLLKSGDDSIWNMKMKSKALYSLVWVLPISGQIEITSAEVAEPGRGGTRAIVHMSETAHWTQGAKMAGILGSLPKLPGTYAFNESTANGATGHFYEDFMRGWKERDRPLGRRTFNWLSLFFAWWEHEEYYWTLAWGLGKQVSNAQAKEILDSLDETEAWLLKQKYFRRWTPADEWVEELRESFDDPALKVKVWKRKGVGMQPVSIDQLLWRRSMIQDPEIHGDLNLFKQEYPADPQEAFLATGRTVFDHEALDILRRGSTLAIWRGELAEPVGADGKSIRPPPADLGYDPMYVERAPGADPD